MVCCARCGPERDEDIAKNKKCECLKGFVVMGGACMIVFLPFLIMLSLGAV